MIIKNDYLQKNQPYGEERGMPSRAVDIACQSDVDDSFIQTLYTYVISW